MREIKGLLAYRDGGRRLELPRLVARRQAEINDTGRMAPMKGIN